MLVYEHGNPNENWIPWLVARLAEKGHQVIVPEFPTPVGQSFEAWKSIIDQYKLEEDTIFVGHSIAVVCILRILETIEVAIRGAVLVSGFLKPLGMTKFDEINKTFYVDTLDWHAIKKHCPSFVVFYSDNDPYVDIKQGEHIACHLGVQPCIIPGAGHFNASSGYSEFNELLESVDSLVIS